MRTAASISTPGRGAAPGLVSVPTTGNPGLSASLSASEASSGAKALQRLVGAFPLDREGRKKSSLRMAVGFAARAHAVSEKGHRSDTAWMVTLTYAGDNAAWRPEHVKEAIRHCRNWCKRSGFSCRYVWVAELQERGVIHYHAVFWLPKNVRMPKWDKRGWWPYGMTNTLKARCAAAYLMSYLKKDQNDERGSFPHGSRRYGVGGLDHSLRRARRWLRLPSFVQKNSDIHDDWQRAVGGGWTAPSGQHFASEFAQMLVGGVRCLVRVARHISGSELDASGPFSWLARGPALSI